MTVSQGEGADSTRERPAEEEPFGYFEILVVIHGSFALVLVAWPFLSYGAIFFFDNPTPEQLPLATRMAWSVWLYPVTYVAGVVASVVSHKRKERRLALAFAFAPMLNALVFCWSAMQLG